MFRTVEAVRKSSGAKCNILLSEPPLSLHHTALIANTRQTLSSTLSF